MAEYEALAGRSKDAAGARTMIAMMAHLKAGNDKQGRAALQRALALKADCPCAACSAADGHVSEASV